MASYQKRGKAGLWSVRFDIQENGQSITKRLSGFERKKDAEEAYVNFIKQYKEELKNKPAAIDPHDIREKMFSTVFEEYYNYEKGRLKDSTLYDMNSVYLNHILPYFEKYKIKEIQKIDILQWQLKLNHFSYKYKSRIRDTLHSFYKYLYYYYDIDNVVARVEPYKKPIRQKEMEIWSLEDFQKFIDSFSEKEIKLRTLFYLLYYTGCRIGEALALNYKDINFEEATLSITKSFTNKNLDKKNKTYSITSTKNQPSTRKILIPKILLKELLNYVDTLPTCKESEFLFEGEKLRPISTSSINYSLEKHCSKADIKKIRVHDFRHSHTSLLIQKGANILLVSKRLGHKNTQQTLNTYSHLFPNSERELIDLIDSF